LGSGVDLTDFDEDVAHYPDSDVDAIWDTSDFGRFFFGVPAIVNSGNRRPFGVFSACVRIGKAIFGCRACARRRARGLRIAATGRQKKFRLLWDFRLSFFWVPGSTSPILTRTWLTIPIWTEMLDLTVSVKSVTFFSGHYGR